MTRIVAGSIGGRRLQVPPRGTRPTSERVREAIFSSLESLIDLSGARVLDIYGGSGAMGLEALSRGAEHALFIESDRRAAGVLRQNARAVGMSRRSEVLVAKAETALTTSARQPYDVVLADPPYALSGAHLREVLEALIAGGWLAADSVVMMEQSTRGDDWDWPDPLQQIRVRRYGETVVYWALHEVAEQEDAGARGANLTDDTVADGTAN